MDLIAKKPILKNVPLVLPDTLLIVIPLVDNVILPVKNVLKPVKTPNVPIVSILLSSDLTHLNM